MSIGQRRRARLFVWAASRWLYHELLASIALAAVATCYLRAELQSVQVYSHHRQTGCVYIYGSASWRFFLDSFLLRKLEFECIFEEWSLPGEIDEVLESVNGYFWRNRFWILFCFEYRWLMPEVFILIWWTFSVYFNSGIYIWIFNFDLIAYLCKCQHTRSDACDKYYQKIVAECIYCIYTNFKCLARVHFLFQNLLTYVVCFGPEKNRARF